MSEAIATTQAQGGGATAEGSDIALAKALQEQEQAWLYILQPNASNVSASIGDDSAATRETNSSVQSDQYVSSLLQYVLCLWPHKAPIPFHYVHA